MNIDQQLKKAEEKVAALKEKKNSLKNKNYEKIGEAVCKTFGLEPLNLKESLTQIKRINESNEDKNQSTEN
ncbi:MULTISPECIES: hypothetical protein [Pediococcus]|uniref:hypothetical protein n=1 Tax=Pediococcus TaxID=1253 RepID=UPI00070E7A62|nr:MULTISPECIES: hypothetical protein [Pediococcus]AVL00178.1 hypothetical protein PI20285_05725 [Pediococcus inopinatus]KRN61811.1 hypothetical protein IV83_GL000516 [Pediococcus inopinatus]PIO80354.1 hypothetical protein BSQ38_01085 [Pediococcus damnosus]